MNQNKSIEQAADEYSNESLSMEQKNILKTYKPDNFRVAQEMERLAFIAGAKHQKELSDAREKLLLDVIEDMREALSVVLTASQKSEESHALNIYYTAYDTLSSVAKKLEGL